MNELPADLAPPLHLIEAGGISPWWLLLLPLLATLLALWRRQHRTPKKPIPAPPRRTFPKPRPTGLGAKINVLHKRHLDLGDYRHGCHELAKLLRQHMAGTMTLTAREIAIAMKNTAMKNTAKGDLSIGEIFQLLAELQFNPEEPQDSDFSGICELAQETLRSGDGQQ